MSIEIASFVSWCIKSSDWLCKRASMAAFFTVRLSPEITLSSSHEMHVSCDLSCRNAASSRIDTLSRGVFPHDSRSSCS